MRIHTGLLSHLKRSYWKTWIQCWPYNIITCSVRYRLVLQRSQGLVNWQFDCCNYLYVCNRALSCCLTCGNANSLVSVCKGGASYKSRWAEPWTRSSNRSSNVDKRLAPRRSANSNAIYLSLANWLLGFTIWTAVSLVRSQTWTSGSDIVFILTAHMFIADLIAIAANISSIPMTPKNNFRMSCRARCSSCDGYWDQRRWIPVKGDLVHKSCRVDLWCLCCPATYINASTHKKDCSE